MQHVQRLTKCLGRVCIKSLADLPEKVKADELAFKELVALHFNSFVDIVVARAFGPLLSSGIAADVDIFC